jgi:Rrf2 family protein
MAKVLRMLVRGGLLRSTRGVNGGFGLGRPAPEISMLDVLEAIDGPLQLFDPATDGRSHRCPADPVWQQAQEALRGVLAEVSLEDLVSTRVHHGRIIDACRGERGNRFDRSANP